MNCIFCQRDISITARVGTTLFECSYCSTDFLVEDGSITSVDMIVGPDNIQQFTDKFKNLLPFL